MALGEVLVMWFWRRSNLKLAVRTTQDIRRITRILFIDDEDFPTVDILRKAGWQSERISDVDRIDDDRVAAAHIVCVDIRGVGKKLRFDKEGLGLLVAIRREFPEKRLIVYSANKQGNRFSEELEAADRRLAKDLEPARFILAVEELARECFDWDSCLRRAFRVYQSECPGGIGYEDFRSRIEPEVRRGRVSEGRVQVALGVTLKRSAEIAAIIQLFLRGG